MHWLSWSKMYAGGTICLSGNSWILRTKPWTTGRREDECWGGRQTVHPTNKSGTRSDPISETFASAFFFLTVPVLTDYGGVNKIKFHWNEVKCHQMSLFQVKELSLLIGSYIPFPYPPNYVISRNIKPKKWLILFFSNLGVQYILPRNLRARSYYTRK